MLCPPLQPTFAHITTAPGAAHTDSNSEKQALAALVTLYIEAAKHDIDQQLIACVANTVGSFEKDAVQSHVNRIISFSFHRLI